MRTFFLLLLLAGGVVFAIGGAEHFPVEFYQDFRGAQFPSALFKKFTEGDPEDLKPEPEGLRITVPVNEWRSPRAGVGPNVKVLGNFEITVSFELLQTGDQPKGGGAGPVLQVLKDVNASFPKKAEITRAVHPKHGNVFVANLGPALEGGPPAAPRFFPSDINSGKLRLVRTGSRLSWQISAGQTEFFGEIRQEEFGGEELNVRLFADPGREKTGTGSVVLRFLDLRIRADALRGATNGVAKWGAMRLWWIAGVLGGLVLLVAAASTFRRFRRSAVRVKTAERSAIETNRARSPRAPTAVDTAERS